MSRLQGSQPAASADGDAVTVLPDDDIDDPYTDRRWREIVLEPAGEDWEARVTNVMCSLAQQPDFVDQLVFH